MTFPENLKYSDDHSWIDGDGKIGITEFAQNELGEIVHVDMPSVGQRFKKDEVFGSIEAVKTTSDLFAPAAGIVKQINNDVVKEPSAVNSDSYGNGWLIEIELSNATELESLLSASEYKKLTGN